jgi:hypothetical protein
MRPGRIFSRLEHSPSLQGLGLLGEFGRSSWPKLSQLLRVAIKKRILENFKGGDVRRGRALTFKLRGVSRLD